MDAVWDKEPWLWIAPLAVDKVLGDPPIHRPYAQAKVAYDAEALNVIFRIEDRYIRAVARGYQGRVWEDSCVEFFFTPGAHPGDGYFNLEMNCGGAAFFHHQTARGRDVVPVGEADFRRLEIAHSLPAIVDPEIEGPLAWTLEYRLPVEILGKYAPVVRPAAGVVWRANFYKCGDKTSRPHWLAWSPVNLPRPDFHRPEYFGELAFG
ncbi:MAG: diguanylate cyclase [Candidatus Aminicenantes bacterium]|nr:diguanylate cyclase [Candidatus Aminicenantes bacterium]